MAKVYTYTGKPINLDSVSLETQANGMQVIKKGTSLNIYIPLSNGFYLDYPMSRRYKAYSSSIASPQPHWFDNWGIGKVCVKSLQDGVFVQEADIFTAGEAEIAIRVPNSAGVQTFAGGAAHGFEQIIEEDGVRCWQLFVDGKNLAEDEDFDGIAKKVEMIQKSYLYDYGTQTDPFAILTKHWVYENGDLILDNKVEFLREVAVTYAYTAMMCVSRHLNNKASDIYLTNRAIDWSINPFKVYNMEDGWESNINPLKAVNMNRTRVIEFGDYGLHFDFTLEKMEMNPTSTRYGIFVSTNGNGSYNKIYLQFMGSANSLDGVMSKVGGVYRTVARWSIK